jgi:glucuronoarabinoxylan endo-1,4-beta-xylanase
MVAEEHRDLSGRWRVVFVVLALALLSGTCIGGGSRAVSIRWDSVQQTIDGFGGATNETAFAQPLPERLMDFFYTTNGLGFSLLRIRSYPSLGECEIDSGAGACVARDGPTILSTDLKAAQMAVARGARVWSSQWSPPATMKANADFVTGGAMIGTPANYEKLARLFAGFATYVASQGVPLFALSPQNEPDMLAVYPSATWTPRQIHDFVPYLDAAFRSAGVTTTKILIGEQSYWEPRIRLWRKSFRYAAEAMSDPAVAARIDILAAHNYDQRDPTSPPRIPNLTHQRVWQTEVSTSEPFDASITNALVWAQRLHYFLSAARVNAFHYWYLTPGPNHHDNQTLVDSNGRVALRAYAIGNWSKFVRPGWHAVAARHRGPLLVTAFQDAALNDAVIVAVNRQPSAVSDVRFDVGGAMAGSVTPWLTSGDSSLVAQPAVPVVDGSFSYAVPAHAVVTFVGGRKSPGRSDSINRTLPTVD